MKIHYNKLPVIRNQRKMRRYILTDKDREILLKWLNEDVEDQQTRNLLSQIRKNILRISDDISLTLKTIRKMQRMHRRRGRA
jgi:SHS2 domain-containing protein